MNDNLIIDNNTGFNPQTGEFISLPIILSFFSDKEILTDESPVNVSWQVANATSVLINNETVEAVGSKQFHFFEKTTITITALNEGNIPITKSLDIDIDRSPPVIYFFKTNASYAIKGSNIELQWNIDGAKRIEIDNGIGNVFGYNSKIITLGSNGIYKLTAVNYFGYKSEAVAFITIFPTPIIETIQIPTPIFNHNLAISNFKIDSPEIDLSVKLDSELFKLQPPEFLDASLQTNAFFLSKKSINPISEIFEEIQLKIKNKLNR